jgi:two-component SAPR family response regulator
MPQTPVLLIESDPTEIAKIRSNIDNKFQNLIKTANKYNELLESIARQQVQLIILGRFDKFNYFEIGEELHKIQTNLQIVMLCKQELVTDSFRQALKNNGITAISAKEHQKLNQILNTVDRPIDLPIFTGEMVLVIIQEIVAISNDHFGKLAQGNYWRKAPEGVTSTP